MRYAIGLDVGIESVGWSVLELSEEDTPIRIVDLGVRIFDRAEHPKTGASLALPRREARGQRRRLRRRKHRKERIYRLIVNQGILSKEELKNLYNGEISDIYEVRTKALDAPLTNEEFARALIHISQRRGFKSNRKSVEESDKNNGKLLSEINKNKALLETNGYRTIGELFYRDAKFAEQKRNKGDEYKNTVSRDLVEAEVRAIFEAQRKFKKQFATVEIEEKYLDILLSQRSFAEGPGAGPYSGNQIEKMVRECTLEKNERRCSKATYSFQVFNLWQHLNHLRINTPNGTKFLTDEQRKTLFKYAHEHEKFTYYDIRKILAFEMNDEEMFADVRYEDDVKKSENSKKIKDLEIYHDIRKCLSKVSKASFEKLKHEDLDVIGEIFSKNYSDEDILIHLESLPLSEDEKYQLLNLPNYSKYGHLSLVACRKLLPFLEQGMTYDKACENAGYDFKAQGTRKGKYLLPIDKNEEEITNPVVKRAISQTIKVINAIIRKMDETSPVFVNIELARELSKNKDERNKLEKIYSENSKENERIVEQIKSYGIDKPTGQDIIKFKLWREQSEVCPYSQTHLSLEKLFEPGYVDIDHIVPYSRSFDDRLVNKVLVKSSENRQKGNRLPLEYLQGEKRDKFIVWVNSQNYKRAKKNLLLKESLNDEEGWKARNLQDTQFISSFLNKYISNTLEFAPSAIDKKRRVYTVNGAVTAYVRKRWGIQKIRANGDLHHAVDATVVACISQSMINIIQKHSFYKETYEIGAYKINADTGEAIERFPKPWKHFIEELNIRLETDANVMRKMLFDVNYPTYSEIDLNDIKAPFVSRMSNHKVTGPAHEATARKKKADDNGKSILISKVDIKKLKLDKDGEIAGYYNPDSDKLLYEALKKRLSEYGNNGEKAFAEPFYKPRSDGSDGPIVKKVKICDTASLTVDINDVTAVAKNDTMVRCDVFYVEDDGYYFVPIYVADTVKKELPNLACVAGKKQWKRMDDSNFVFSLYPNTLIKYYSKKNISLKVVNNSSELPSKKEIEGSKGTFLYYKGLNISTAVINAVTHDNSYWIESIGKTSLKLEKYEVDVLGTYRKIEKEERRTFNLKK